jgi:hypothetical protein
MSDATGAALREAAGTGLYRRNAFRLTGMPTYADRRTLRRRQQQVVTALEVGADVPGLPDADPDEVRTAFDRLLGDPRRRLVDEFFWLWGTPDAAGCRCPASLHRAHDDAVRAHHVALQAELADEESIGRRDELWREAGQSWEETLRRAVCWDHVRHRIEALDDRQLDPSVVDTLRDGATVTLLKPLTDLVAARADARLADHARRWPAPRAAVQDRLEEASEPLYRSVRETTKAASETLDDGDCVAAARRVYEDVLPELKKLEAVAPEKDHRRTASTANSVAVLLNNCASALIDLEGSRAEQQATRWLNTARKLATDPRTVQTVDGNKAALAEIVGAIANLRRQVDELLAMGRRDVAASILRDLLRRVGGAAGSAEIQLMLDEVTGRRGVRTAAGSGSRSHPPFSTYEWYQPVRRPAMKGGRWVKWAAVIAVVVVGYLFVTRCGVSEDTVTLAGEATADNAPSGTCVAMLEDWEVGEYRREVPEADCDAPHWGEVLGQPFIAPRASGYPGDEAAASEPRFCCEELRESQGLDAELFTTAFAWPGAELWNEAGGDPTDNYATCVVHRVDGIPLQAPVSSPQQGSSGGPLGVMLEMDPFSRDAAANPPPGVACVQRGVGTGEVLHEVPVTACENQHWARTAGYPQLYEPGTPFPGNEAVTARAEAACAELAEEERLTDGWRQQAGTPGESRWPQGPLRLAAPDEGGEP